MSIHLYTNGAWTDSGRIYRNSLNLFFKIIPKCNLDSTGRLVNDVSDQYEIWCAAVSSDNTYACSKVGGCYGFTTTEPFKDDYTYDNQRILYSNDLIFTPPQEVGFIVVRYAKDSTEKMCNLGNILLPYEPYNVVDWYTNHGHGYSSGAWS